MPTISRANTDRLSVAEAKHLILNALPNSEGVDHVRIYGHLDEDGEPVWDMDSLQNGTGAEANERYINNDFLGICQSLGFEPHLKWSPARGGYVASGANDRLYMLTHAEFVQVASRYSLMVVIEPETLRADPSSAAANAPNNEGWNLVKPQRFQSYNKPLYDFLKAAHQAGLPRPSARDVLEAWRSNVPMEVAKVMVASFDYYDAEGNTKEADLDAIRKTIDRLTRKPAR